MAAVMARVSVNLRESGISWERGMPVGDYLDYAN